MPDTAATRLNRMVQLVAELSRREREGLPPVELDELAQHLGTRPSLLLSDVRVLTEATNDSEATWLLSLQVYQDRRGIGASSLGPYRRPIRFTADELLALRVALATEEEAPSAVLRQLAELGDGDDGSDGRRVISPIPFLHGGQASVVELARSALNGERPLKLVYAGEAAERPSERVVQVHDVVAAKGRYYLIAWCEWAQDWRRFRADRVLEAELLEGSFASRADAPAIERAGDLFQAPADAIDHVKVRFSPRIARWACERHRDAEASDDGSAVVTFRCASIDWLVRTVLQYGDEAEVLEPVAYREAVRRAVG